MSQVVHVPCQQGSGQGLQVFCLFICRQQRLLGSCRDVDSRTAIMLDLLNLLRCCWIVPCRAVPCRAVPCRAVPCRAVPCRAVPCCAVLCCAGSSWRQVRRMMSCGMQRRWRWCTVARCTASCACTGPRRSWSGPAGASLRFSGCGGGEGGSVQPVCVGASQGSKHMRMHALGQEDPGVDQQMRCQQCLEGVGFVALCGSGFGRWRALSFSHLGAPEQI
jgi:hypothetical protein